MKTATLRNTPPSCNSTPRTDAQLQDALDALAMRASRGDRRAIGAIAIAFGPRLLQEARAVLGDLEQEAEDVLQDFFLCLVDRRSRFTPVRAIARKRRADRERDWATESGS
jgi:DNA-directed RNA polymerase specialized sigma24 family protein